MAKKITAEQTYTLEKTGEEEVTLHYKLQRSPGGAPRNWFFLGLLSVPFGAFPGAVPAIIISSIIGQDEPSIWLTLVFWAATIILCFWKCRKAWLKQTAHGAPLTKIVFTKDELHTALDTVLDRASIASSFSRTADELYTYRSNAEQKAKHAAAERKQNLSYEVGVEYGAKEISVTPKALTPNQGQAIADAVAHWKSSPSDFFERAAA